MFGYSQYKCPECGKPLKMISDRAFGRQTVLWCEHGTCTSTANAGTIATKESDAFDELKRRTERDKELKHESNRRNTKESGEDTG